jgi:hypothetical protein
MKLALAPGADVALGASLPVCCGAESIKAGHDNREIGAARRPGRGDGPGRPSRPPAPSRRFFACVPRCGKTLLPSRRKIFSSGLRLCPADVRENNPLKACPSRPRVKFGIRNTPCCRADARLSAAVCAYAIWHSQKRCGPIPRDFSVRQPLKTPPILVRHQLGEPIGDLATLAYPPPPPPGFSDARGRGGESEA